MARYVFDTSILIEVERQRLDVLDVVLPSDELGLAAVTVAEVMAGPLRCPDAEGSEAQPRALALLDRFDILSYDRTVALVHAELLAATTSAGRPRGPHDLIIAATARATSRTVLTADTGFLDLPGVDVRLVERP